MKLKNKIYIFIIILLAVFVCSGVFLIILKNKNLSPSSIGDQQNTIDILDAPIFNLTKNEDWEMLHVANGIEKKVTYKDQAIIYLVFSPSKEKLAFYQDSKYYPNLCSDTVLIVMDIKKKSFKQVYEGDCKTSSWEWLNNKEIVVYRNCGTACMVGYLTNLNTGEKTELHYGLGYEWSPNKELALAYNYSIKYGITIGDKKDNIIFSLRREADSNLIDKIKAAWSPDSSKIALIIKKEGEEKLELLVFGVKNDFKQIYQADVGLLEEIILIWNGSKKVILNNQEISIDDLQS